MREKVIISGIMPSNYGVGRVMKRIVSLGKEKSYNVIFPHMKNSISQKIKNGDIFGIIIEIKNRVLNAKYNNALKNIKNSKVIVIHIQTIGFDNIFRLIENQNDLSIYVMDNSFFCIKSYNHINGEYTECLRCIDGIQNCIEDCKPYPVAFDKNINFEYIIKLKAISKKIRFLVQNINQANLLKKVLGDDIRFKIVGLKTNEFNNFNIDISKNSEYAYDVVYHGAAVEAKGLKYVLEIAKKLPNVNFLIPEDKEKCNIFEDYNNIVFKAMSWETGLETAVQNSKLIMCPSLWSAPIEGAIVKSIIHNGNVALFDAQYSFANELPNDCVLKMDSDIEKSAEKVNKYFQNSLYCYTEKSKVYMKTYLDKYDLGDVLS